MAFPRLTVNLPKIAENVRAVNSFCQRHGIQVCGVTKACCGDYRIARVFAQNGLKVLGDSRLSNLRNYQGLDVIKMLIRAPSLTEVSEAVQIADVSINTELQIISALDQECEKKGISRHGVLLMCDMGDLREGIINKDELLKCIEYINRSQRLWLWGLGTNFNCLSFVLPDENKMQELGEIVSYAKNHSVGHFLEVSGGNSTNLRMLLDNKTLGPVTSLRLGESLLFGRERETYTYLPETHNDAFIFQAEIIELKNKPSMPHGKQGVDSYGKYHQFADKGMRKRAILSFGHLDCDEGTLWPLDSGIEIVGSSSDHTVVDVTDSELTYRIGDIVEFRCGYHAAARAFSSPYVEKVFIE